MSGAFKIFSCVLKTIVLSYPNKCPFAALLVFGLHFSVCCIRTSKTSFFTLFENQCHAMKIFIQLKVRFQIFKNNIFFNFISIISNKILSYFLCKNFQIK